MDTRVDKTPRQLAREYYNGQLSLAEYRELRRRRIDEITRPDPTRPVVPATPQRETEHREPARTETPAAESGTPAWLLPVAGVVVVGLVAGWLLLSGDHGKPPAVEQSAAIPAVPAGTEAAAPVSPLLDEFLAANDWKYDALAGLTLSWSGLQDQEQQAVRDSESFRAFSERLRERVLEQRALRGIDPDAPKREQLLLSLAQHLGVPGLEPVAPAIAASDGKGKGKPVAEPEVVTAEAAAPVPATRPARAPVSPPAATTPAAPDSAAVARTTEAGGQGAAGRPAASVAAMAATASTDKPAPAAASGNRAGKPAADTQPALASGGGAAAAVPATAAAPTNTSSADACRASLARTRRPLCNDRMKDGSPGPLMIVLPAGSFLMGSTHEASEQPVHKVTIAHPFAISAYEVSVAEYRKFCQDSGRYCEYVWKGDHEPAVKISWKDAQSYVHWLSTVTGATYRLPTEAEWEYAARGRSNADYPVGDGTTLLPSDARFNTSSPLPVDDRSVNVNGFRLRHIIGNVREWVEDSWHDNYQGAASDGRAWSGNGNGTRVVRGGSYADAAYALRASARNGITADTRDAQTGLRLVRVIAE